MQYFSHLLCCIDFNEDKMIGIFQENKSMKQEPDTTTGVKMIRYFLYTSFLIRSLSSFRGSSVKEAANLFEPLLSTTALSLTALNP